MAKFLRIVSFIKYSLVYIHCFNAQFTISSQTYSIKKIFLMNLHIVTSLKYSRKQHQTHNYIFKTFNLYIVFRSHIYILLNVSIVVNIKETYATRHFRHFVTPKRHTYFIFISLERCFKVCTEYCLTKTHNCPLHHSSLIHNYSNITNRMRL